VTDGSGPALGARRRPLSEWIRTAAPALGADRCSRIHSIPRRATSWSKSRFDDPNSKESSFSSFSNCARVSALVPLCSRSAKAHAAGPCRGPPARARLPRVPHVRLPIPIAAFRAHGRLSQLSARSGLYVEGQRPSRRVRSAGRLMQQK